ncbi:uncharacterized protein LOC123722716 [Papilio machaon]|uniref:uncharacterized protein LOC123722716 n=1 Tax=Papilio machaon TaxID=76193 RepID=UPI001E663174|nr:uncharacterized protein LOC123722716 [Papilio machaon]
MNEKLNKNSYYNRQTNDNCVELSDNTLCIIVKDKEKLYGLKRQTNKYPNEGLVDITRLKDDLRFLTGITRTKSNVDKFSEDYLDVGDLSATRKEADIFNNPKNLYSKLKLIIASLQSKNGLTPNLISRKVNVADLINFIDFRSHNTDTSEESIEKYKKKKKNKPKRFEVVENTNESVEPRNSESEESSNEMSIPLKNRNIPKIIYVQGPTRHIPSDERRSRLPHFMPKRYHWSLDDIKDLPYFWFNGPQGYYAGVYRVFI